MSESDDQALLYISRAITVLAGWADGYLEGNVTLEAACKGMRMAVDAVPDSVIDHVPGGRDSLLGLGLRRATQCEPLLKGRKNGMPDALKDEAARLVIAVHDLLQLPITRASKSLTPTAFDQVAIYLQEAGVKRVTPRMVEEWYVQYQSYRKSTDD